MNPETNDDEIQVLGKTGETVVYVFPSGGAEALRGDLPSEPDTPENLLMKRLVEAELITASQRDTALRDQQITGMQLSEVLVARGWITEEKLQAFL
ncbi:hypothetical protein H6F90_12385 [Trichocoleus sp. FACHB-591]|uniref:hypothetical protein n=1 Tax=Trichocoleus sp. FACHB-591 TaxID=2692872 RepID=UPI0016855525|nr:hypothetical protein [Trichocoleus sp. FACHB-591]MBD2095946.1 hypothetical protein [Trichocoleus sp. FACHB-591]